MTLNEFINKRMAELGLKYVDLTAVIAGRTLQKIRAGETAGIREGTFQKLAQILKCSIGDLKACCTEKNVRGAVTEYEMELLARKNGGHPIMDAAARREEAVKDNHPEEAEPDQERENEMKCNFEAPKEAPVKAPVKQEVLEELFPDNDDETERVNSDELADAIIAELAEAVNAYKRRLKDICLKTMTQNRKQCPVTELYADIGRALLEELMKEEQKAG